MLFNEPEKIPEVDAATQYRFDEGHLIGELAKKLFPDGIDIPAEDFIGNIKKTTELLQQRITLFEAGILAGNIYARADILNPASEDKWDIIEVKGSTEVKDVHVSDVAFQRFCYEKAGLKIRKCFLAYINNEYVKDGDIDPVRLFKTEDISSKVDEASAGIQEQINAMLEVITAGQCPDISIGRQCNDPYGCPLTALCWSFLPENHIFNLYRGGKKSLELFNGGILTIRDIPDDFKLNDKQRVQKACDISGEPYIDKEGIQQFLSSLQYPLYFFDFETISPAVPLFDGTRPYQKIPFQFSLHVVESEDSKPEHVSFLAEGTGDPRPELLSELKKVLGNKGSIVVYNQSFEKGILEELGVAFPEYGDWITGVTSRLVDLLVPFRSFCYYHPSQQGSASLKAVLPALTGISYEGMNINNGEDASLAFLEVTYGDVSDEVRSKVRKDLEEYCGLDTEGMIRIIDRLRGIG